MGGGSARWLLIGNSRWHWARLQGSQLITWHSPPESAPVNQLQGWAAVGPVPTEAELPQERRLRLADVPLLGAPPWLGVDRALAGWQAWRLTGGPVLVADAGTVLSLTRVDGEGRFGGGRLIAGLALQLRAMAAGTAVLPALPPDRPARWGDQACPCSWPKETGAAMREGVGRGLAAAVVAAALELMQQDQDLELVITGGDGECLLPLIVEGLAGRGRAPQLWPSLCLEAMVALGPFRPGRDR